MLPKADFTHNASSNGRVMRAWGPFGHTPFKPSALPALYRHTRSLTPCSPPRAGTRLLTHKPHPNPSHSTRQAPHSLRALAWGPRLSPLPQAPQAPALRLPMCRNNPSNTSGLGANAGCRQSATRIPTCKQPWLVSTLSLLRMFCCNLATCFAARQSSAKRRSAVPSRLLSSWSAMQPRQRRWCLLRWPVLGRFGCSCPHAPVPKVLKQQLLARFTAFFQGDLGSLLRAPLTRLACTALRPVINVLLTWRTSGNCPQHGRP